MLFFDMLVKLLIVDYLCITCFFHKITLVFIVQSRMFFSAPSRLITNKSASQRRTSSFLEIRLDPGQQWFSMTITGLKVYNYEPLKKQLKTKNMNYKLKENL